MFRSGSHTVDKHQQDCLKTERALTFNQKVCKQNGVFGIKTLNAADMFSVKTVN